MSQICTIFFAVSSLLLCGFISITGAMECPFYIHNRSGIDALDAVVDRLHSCPPLIFHQEDEYCCIDTELKYYCCNLPGFVVNISLWLTPIIIILLIICYLSGCFKKKPCCERVYRTGVPPYQTLEQQQFMAHYRNGSSTTATN